MVDYDESPEEIDIEQWIIQQVGRDIARDLELYFMRAATFRHPPCGDIRKDRTFPIELGRTI